METGRPTDASEYDSCKETARQVVDYFAATCRQRRTWRRTIKPLSLPGNRPGLLEGPIEWMDQGWR